MKLGKPLLCLLVSCAGVLCAQDKTAQSPGNAPAPMATTLPANVGSLMDERVNTTVFVEFFVQDEIDRDRLTCRGIVLDKEGLIVLADTALSPNVPPNRLKDFKVHLLGEDSDGYTAEYLGINYVSGTHYIRVEKAARGKLRPITDFAVAKPRTGEMLWGIASQEEDFLYKPLLDSGSVVFTHGFPLMFGFTRPEVAGIGAPVFNAKGDFVGVGTNPSSQSYMMFVGGKSGRIALAPLDETNTFIWADDYLKYVRRIPQSPAGDPEPWLGIEGAQPIDKDVAHFLNLEKQGAIVVSEIIAKSPADVAGFKNKDIIVTVDGKPLPKLHPDNNLLRWLTFYVADKKVDDSMVVEVVRGDKRENLTVKLVARPTRDRNAAREYFPRLGLSVRDFTIDDAMKHRLFQMDLKGAVVSFLRKNAPASTAEMKVGDWIKEVDGVPVTSYAQTVEKLSAIDKDLQKKEAVIMVSRGTETKVFRLKLN